MSYALRHAPWEYELEMDEGGWVSIIQLLHSLQEEQKWSDVKAENIYYVAKTSDKGRFEIADSKIRALYGHSIPLRIIKAPGEPPQLLYHGTSRQEADAIMANGLEPRGRQYVHMAVDPKMALQVGKRRDNKPVLLTIKAREARQDGVAFYKGNDLVWLAEFVVAKYIDIEEKN